MRVRLLYQRITQKCKHAGIDASAIIGWHSSIVKVLETLVGEVDNANLLLTEIALVVGLSNWVNLYKNCTRGLDLKLSCRQHGKVQLLLGVQRERVRREGFRIAVAAQLLPARLLLQVHRTAPGNLYGDKFDVYAAIRADV